MANLPATAQNQAPSTSPSSSSGSSLGDYARHVRKEPSGKSTPKVFDNDNLPTGDKLSVIGQTPAPAVDNSTAAKTEQSETGASVAKSGGEVKAPSAPAANTPEDDATKQAAAKQWADKIAAQKDQVDLLARELDVLQREYQIRAAAMYADAGNRLRNQADWDKQDAQYKQQIADKQKSLDDAKQKMDDLDEAARKAGTTPAVPGTQEPKPATP
jgi:hypothetical protein